MCRRTEGEEKKCPECWPGGLFAEARNAHVFLGGCHGGELSSFPPEDAPFSRLALSAGILLCRHRWRPLQTRRQVSTRDPRRNRVAEVPSEHRRADTAIALVVHGSPHRDKERTAERRTRSIDQPNPSMFRVHSAWNMSRFPLGLFVLYSCSVDICGRLPTIHGTGSPIHSATPQKG